MNWRRNGSRRAGPASVTTRQIITDIATTIGTAFLIASLIGPLFRTDCTTQRLRPNVDKEQKGICRALPTVLRRCGGMALILKSECQALFSWDEKLGVFPWRTLPILKVQSREKVGNKPEMHVRQALLQYRAIAWLGRVLIECRTLKEPVR
ncbi:hypothetical protein IWQ52_000919 [Labrenzia sp. EL_159]|nr:hypothetical protein [Labrenzia sp. EL_162]MBG6193417.1 hypothetical protein [Labrenzia sp. EL_159]